MTIRKILIANRGEVAHRIARTARQLGIQTVGIAAETDNSREHRKACDTFVVVPDIAPTALFLSPELLVSLAQEQGADAIHPGYGFLSESPLLSQCCHDADIIFIGPSPAALSLFGDKAASKARAKELGIPVLETTTIDLEEDSHKKTLLHLQKTATFPLLVKARAGGGGRGMRLIHTADELEQGCEAAFREAKKFFGDGTLLIEPYLQNIKHIEIQIVGDTKEKVLHLYERECSAQRNYQKILEEAPSCSISSSCKEQLYQSAVKLCSGISYEGLGTVEFLVTDTEEFYFTEVNPRLQVEHPVTEEILGIDLVALQLHVAEKKPLSDFSPNITKLSPCGHAIQSRVNAENAIDFRPSTGALWQWECPIPSEHLRVESGFSLGSEVSPHFDSLLMKYIARAPNRLLATERLQKTLLETKIAGVETNIPFLLRVLGHHDWITGKYTTSLTEDIQEKTPSPEEIVFHHAVAAFLAMDFQPQATFSSWDTSDAYRLVHPMNREVIASCHEKTVHLSLSFLGEGQAQISSTGDYSVTGEPCHDIAVSLERISYSFRGQKRQYTVATRPEQYWITGPVLSAEVHLASPVLKAPTEEQEALSKIILSPLPGTVIRVSAKTDDSVQKGDQLLVLESMKMEHAIVATTSGTVHEVLVKEGDVVQAGQQLIFLG